MAGARIVYMTEGIKGIEISPELIGETLDVTATAAGRDSRPTVFIYEAAHLKPLSPAHLSVKERATGHILLWIRRSREDADSWVGEVSLGEERELYRVRLWNGETLVEEAEVDSLEYDTEVSFTHFDVAQWSDTVGWGATSIFSLTI